jgi:predicted hydrolase (HD superfamily)
MAVSYADVERQLLEWTEGASLRNHARAVEAVMRRAAYRHGRGEADEPTWAIAGLIHDADYERWPEEHPGRVVQWLSERGEEAIAHAVAAHVHRTGVPFETPLDRALAACDELTGFVMACCLVRPDGIGSLAPSSVKKKLKDRSFAAKVDRDEIREAVARLGVDLDEHIRMVIEALTPHAAALGLAGTSRPEAGGSGH